jgi:hypothetical protein
MEQTQGGGGDGGEVRPDPREQVELFMKRKGVNGKIIMAMVTGSQAYNLANELSDHDFFGVRRTSPRTTCPPPPHKHSCSYFLYLLLLIY